jgi:cell division protein ZapE
MAPLARRGRRQLCLAGLPNLHSTIVMTSSLSARYAELVAAGEIEADPAQQAVVEKFFAIERDLAERDLARKSSSLGWLFGRSNRAAAPVKGLYLHGDVGRGKTMLMDLFFATSSVARKRRVHFHEFMADVHERVHQYRQQLKNGTVTGDDPITPVAAALAQEARLLCFDEFNVTDIADAMILGRLFARLFAHGVAVIATSNVAPEDLYRDGLNRGLFLPFIELLRQNMHVLRLAARTDFRLEKLGGMPVWHVPADAAADAALDEAWRRLAAGRAGAEQSLTVKGRKVRVPRAAMGVARFSFHDLCEEPLGASDYLKIAHDFHTLLLDRVPVMDFDRRNAAKRFIILIDTLYDQAVKLLASADAQPHALYQASEGFEVLEFRRTASRLIEMRSRAYLALPHGPRDARSAAAITGIVET